MGCCTKFKDRHKGLLLKAKQTWDVITILLYFVDIATDGYASYCYYQLGDVYWGTLTLCFIFPAMIFTSISFMSEIIKGPDSILNKCLWTIVAICFAPLITLVVLAWSIYGSIKGDATSIKGMGYIKLTEGVLESGPESCLQLYIIFQYMADETKVVGAWQYLTLCVSIITLAIGISNCMVFKASTVITKVSFFVFGSVTIVARLLICSTFSLVMKPLWLLPMGTFIVASITIWLVKKCCTCSDVPLGRGHTCTPHNIPDMFVTWFVTAVFNTFTVSGLPIAAISLAYAIGGYFLVPGIISIVTITLAALSLLANILMVAIPQFRVIGDNWLVYWSNFLGDDAGGSWFY